MGSLTVSEWCRRHRLSAGFFYKLLAKGEAPASFKIGAARRISLEADAAWVAQRQAEEARNAVKSG